MVCSAKEQTNGDSQHARVFFGFRTSDPSTNYGEVASAIELKVTKTH